MKKILSTVAVFAVMLTVTLMMAACGEEAEQGWYRMSGRVGSDEAQFIEFIGSDEKIKEGSEIVLVKQEDGTWLLHEITFKLADFTKGNYAARLTYNGGTVSNLYVKVSETSSSLEAAVYPDDSYSGFFPKLDSHNVIIDTSKNITLSFGDFTYTVVASDIKNR